MSAIDVACEIGKSIITDHAVTSATQTLMTSTISGGAQIVGAAATGGNVSAAVSAAGASISSASAGVGNAVMGTQVVFNGLHPFGISSRSFCNWSGYYSWIMVAV